MELADLSFGSNLPVFTPVRRRQSTTNTRQLHSDPGIEWTAARCHRLLRALTSRVAILTKDLARYSAEKQAVNGSNRRAAEPKVADGEWDKTKRRIRQTYSNKGKRGGKMQNGEESRMLPPPNKKERPMAPGEVLVPTPVLARARRYSEERPNLLVPEEPEEHMLGRNKRRRIRADGNGARFQLSENLRDLRSTTSASRFAVYEGIHNGLEALLVATAPPKPEVKRKGARSLFSMALRAVPTYIAQQEGLIEYHVEEMGRKSTLVSRDMSTEIYDELEAFGSSGHGWRHLRTVVRSHGIQVISEAILAGLLELDFVGCLITLCTRVSALDEAQTLFSTLLSSTQFSPPKSIYDKSNRVLSMLWKFTEHTGMLSFQYRQLSSLFTLGLLPVEWVATKDFSAIWTGLFQTLVPGSESAETLMFLDTLLLLLASTTKHPQAFGYTLNSAILEAVSNTRSSLLTTLLSIIVLNRERSLSNISTDVFTQIGGCSRILSLLNTYNTQSQLDDEESGFLPSLARLIAQGESISDDQKASVSLLTKNLQQTMSQNRKLYRQAVLFTCSTARCCGRGAFNSGFDYLRNIHHYLGTCEQGSTNIFQSLIVDSAFSFAEQIPEPEHLQYATDIDAKLGVTRFEDCHNIAEGERRGGFRWEEGICEWVAASPLAVKRASARIQPLEESDCDTPYKPPAQLRRQLEQESLALSVAICEPEIEEMASPGGFGHDNADDVQNHTRLLESEDELGEDYSQSTSFSGSDVSLEDSGLSSEDESLTSNNSLLSFLNTRAVHRYSHKRRAPRLSQARSLSSQGHQVGEDDNICSSPSTKSDDSFTTRQRSMDRAPRLGRPAVQSAQTWPIFDDSDDELSFVSVSSSSQSQPRPMLQDVTDTSINTRCLRQRTEKVPSVPKLSKPTKRRIPAHANSSDGEDELGL
jgi:hypothetical protein